ncbi:MAG: FtsX-like permease family protein [Anaerolineae bacterium]|nr:FtsX-like permease family protein [Anaerolineae bacterium]
MMNASMLAKIWGDITTRKGRTIMVSVAIFIGVLGVVTLITSGDLLVRQLQADIKPDELPMVQYFVTIPGDAPDDLDHQATLETLRAQPQVERAEGVANVPFFWKRTDETRFRESRLFAFSEPMDQITLEPLRLVRGIWPKTGQQQIAIEQRMADDFNLDVGDLIDLRILSDIENLPTESWTIAAVVFHPYSQMPDESMFTTFEDAQHIANVIGFNILNVRYTTYDLALEMMDDFTIAITEDTPYRVAFQFQEDPAKNQRVKSTEQYANILGALAVVAMLVSGFLVINVINNLVVEQKRQIGVMKSLGARRTEAFMIYAGIAFIYGVFGMIPGVLIGIPAGYKMAQIVGDFANTLIDEFQVSPLGITLGVVLGLAVPVISAVLPVYNGTRVSILDAMTDLGISGGYRVGPIARLIRALPFPVTIRQSLANINQKKWRLALTVITLTMAITAFMGVSAVFVRINDVLQSLLDTFAFEIQIEPTQSQDYETVETLLMDNIEGIKEVFPGTGLAMQVDGYVNAFSNTSQLIITGIEPGSELLKFDLAEGTAWNDDPTRKGIVLTNEVASQIDKHVGDIIVMTTGGRKLELELIGIANFPFDIGFMLWRDLALFAGYTTGAPKPNEYFVTAQADGYTAGTLPGGGVMAWGASEDAIGFLPLSAGDPVVPGEPGVLITDALAENGGYAVGDMITLTAGDHTGTFPITGTFAVPSQMTEAGLPADMVLFFWEDLARFEGRSLAGDPVPNVFLIVLEDGSMTPQEVDEVIEEINQLLVSHGITSSFTNMVEIADQATKAVLSIGIILNLASLVMAAVGAIGLLTTLSISVFERQKEIGVMRSVGAGSWTIITQFLVEGVFVGIIAWIIAAPLSVGLSYLLTSLLPFGEFIEFAYPVWMFGAGLIGILIIATISSIWPSVAASRKTVSDILRYQ